MKSEDYETQLAAWKTKHGFRDLDPSAEEDEMLRAADKALKGEDYCVICGNGPQKIAEMCLITRRDDPYIQPEESDEDENVQPDNRVRACPKCWAIEYGDEDELSDDAAEPSNNGDEQRLRPKEDNT